MNAELDETYKPDIFVNQYLGSDSVGVRYYNKLNDYTNTGTCAPFNFKTGMTGLLRAFGAKHNTVIPYLLDVALLDKSMTVNRFVRNLLQQKAMAAANPGCSEKVADVLQILFMQGPGQDLEYKHGIDYNVDTKGSWVVGFALSELINGAGDPDRLATLATVISDPDYYIVRSRDRSEKDVLAVVTTSEGFRRLKNIPKVSNVVRSELFGDLKPCKKSCAQLCKEERESESPDDSQFGDILIDGRESSGKTHQVWNLSRGSQFTEYANRVLDMDQELDKRNAHVMVVVQATFLGWPKLNPDVVNSYGSYASNIKKFWVENSNGSVDKEKDVLEPSIKITRAAGSNP